MAAPFPSLGDSCLLPPGHRVLSSLSFMHFGYFRQGTYALQRLSPTEIAQTKETCPIFEVRNFKEWIPKSSARVSPLFLETTRKLGSRNTCHPVELWNAALSRHRKFSLTLKAVEAAQPISLCMCFIDSVLFCSEMEILGCFFGFHQMILESFGNPEYMHCLLLPPVTACTSQIPI